MRPENQFTVAGRTVLRGINNSFNLCRPSKWERAGRSVVDRFLGMEEAEGINAPDRDVHQQWQGSTGLVDAGSSEPGGRCPQVTEIAVMIFIIFSLAE